MNLEGQSEMHPEHREVETEVRPGALNGSDNLATPGNGSLLHHEPNADLEQGSVFQEPGHEMEATGTEEKLPSEEHGSDADGLFRSWAASGYDPWPREDHSPIERIPHFGHLAVLGLIALLAILAVNMLTRSALHFHFLGVTTVQQALSDTRFTLGSQAILYLLTLQGCLLFFPLLWHKGFFAGLQWNSVMAIRLRYRLLAAAFACFLCALVNGWLLPGPENTPIDKLFRSPGAAWILFIFGVSFAPFFEEIIFRGFLLPSLCTAFDWAGEKATGRLPRRPFPNGHPRWSVRSMTTASMATSIPFALMHAEQTGYAIGPFLLLVFVSMVLCWARLSSRSLAASVLVHASYNFMLFSLMLLGTGGFQHMDKM